MAEDRDLNELIEVAPGVEKRYGDCTVEDLHGAASVLREAGQLYDEVAALLKDAAERGLSVPRDLGDRIKQNLDSGHPLVLVELRNELRVVVSDQQGGGA
jgi:hypothetical protein